MLTERIKEYLHGEADYDTHGLLREAFAELTSRLRTRLDRQLAVHGWCVAAFGDDHAKSIEQRGIRLVEEAIEAAQACGCDRDMVHRLVDHVYNRPVGELYQEVGGVAVTMLALCEAAGLDADEAERTEVERVLSKPLEHFRARNEAKNAAGFDVLAGGAPEAQQPLHDPANNAGVATGSRNGSASESVTLGNLPPPPTTPTQAAKAGEAVGPLMKCICTGPGAGCTNRCDRGQIPPLPAKTFTIHATTQPQHVDGLRQGNWHHPDGGRIVGWVIEPDDMERMKADAFCLPRELAECLTSLRDARLAAFPEARREGDAWQPIETAPKSVADGRRVSGIYLLGYVPDDNMVDPMANIDIVWWEPLLPNKAGTRGKWCRSAGDTAVECAPTLWQPLPAPPVEVKS